MSFDGFMTKAQPRAFGRCDYNANFERLELEVRTTVVEQAKAWGCKEAVAWSNVDLPNWVILIHTYAS